MPTQAKPYRYQLPPKAIKSDCPDCGPQHKMTLSRYVDTRTGETLPEEYGRCDRQSNCGYYLNPYQKDASGVSYADEVKARNGAGNIPKELFHIAGNWKRNGYATRESVVTELQGELVGATPEQAEAVARYIFDKPKRLPQSTPAPVYSIPDEVFSPSLGRYDQNQFARLLIRHFGLGVALDLLQRFQIGTSSHWPGACVFWYIDEQGRKRGGQIKLFGKDWHTAKYVDREGKQRSKTSWVHFALLRRCKAKETPVPDWLTEYDQKAERSPCLFGLPQLPNAPVDQPIAIVEAPKTAVVCAAHMPGFTWLAVGALSYLNAERLAPVRGRKIVLFPDLNACYDRINAKGETIKGWLTRANELRAKGFQVEVSTYMEDRATDEQKEQGLDLADFLLNEHKGYPPDWG